MTDNHITTKSLTKTAIMVALVFIATYSIKIPSLHGYTHPGDSMIFIAVLILGTKRGALASGLGAALADLLGGYMYWIIPTFIIKFIMAYLMGIIIEKSLPTFKFNWLIGAFTGGLFQIFGYSFFGFVLFDWAYAIASIPGLIAQTAVGILIAFCVITALWKSKVLIKLKNY